MLFGKDGDNLGATNGIKLDTVQVNPYVFGTTGIYNDSLGNANTNGNYWSRTSYSSARAYRLHFSSTGVSPGTANYDRYIGFSVRCIQSPRATWDSNDGNIVETDLRLMQDITKENFTTKYCANDVVTNALVPLGSTIKLMDSRDSKEHTIVKLEDGNCWMQENLALSGSRTLTSGDSDVSRNFTLPADTTSWGTNSTSNANAVQVKTGNISLSGWQEGYGNYYSWQAATAGTGSSVMSNGGNATSSICPKGWKLPTGGRDASSQFQALFGAGGNNLVNGTAAADYQAKFEKIKAIPYLFPAAGDYNGTHLDVPDVYGYYWSRTAYNSTYAYYLSFSVNDFFPGTNNTARYLGFSVRCIAEPSE